MITHLFTGLTSPLAYLTEGFQSFRIASLTQTSGLKTLLICGICILVLLIHDGIEMKTSVWEWLGRFRRPVRYALYFLLLFVILYSRQLGEYEFVYFQF